MRRAYRAPLVVFTPKSLLRLPAATSTVEELTRGRFEHLLDDSEAAAKPEKVLRLLLCSGKVYYDLLAARKERLGEDAGRVALVRVEQIYPWPGEALQEIVQRYDGAERLYWVQEEPANMGAWSFVRERIQDLLLPGAKLSYAGRVPAASPAAGSMRVHRREQQALIDVAFSDLD